MLFFWGHRWGRCQQFRLQFSLELFDRGTDQGDSLSIAGCRGNRSCVEGVFLKLTVEKRAFGLLAPKSSRRRTNALCTQATYDSLRDSMLGSCCACAKEAPAHSAVTRTARRALPVELGMDRYNQKRNEERTIDGQSLGNGTAFSAVAPPQRPVCDAHQSKIFGSGIPIMSPRARIPGRLTVCFDDLWMHNSS